MVAALDSALEKLPRVEGTVYRTLNFDDVFAPRKEYEDFIAQHAVGMFARYKAYTSASTKTDGYPLPDETKYGVTLEIVSQNARDLADIGNNFESEALFPRRSVFDISKVETDKGGRIRIYMEEVQVNGRDKHHEHDSQKRGVAVRDLQKAHSAHADLQGVPRADPRGDHGRGKNLQGTGEKVKFSLKSPVEESGDLIALQNLTEAEQRTISDAQARFSPGSAQRRTGRTNSDSGVLWRGSETAMDSPDQAVYNEAGKGQSTSSSNSSSGILWAGSDAVPVEGDHNTVKDGAYRANRYSSLWGKGSLQGAVDKFAPNSTPVFTDKGKVIYRNNDTGIEVVYDKNGNYFRINDTNLTGRRSYLDLEGNRLSNNIVTGSGTQRGMTQGEYNALTHFNNID